MYKKHWINCCLWTRCNLYESVCARDRSCNNPD